jgi:hypothetical protein
MLSGCSYQEKLQLAAVSYQGAAIRKKAAVSCQESEKKQSAVGSEAIVFDRPLHTIIAPDGFGRGTNMGCQW